MSLSISELRRAYSYRKIDWKRHIFWLAIASFFFSLIFTFFFPFEDLTLKTFLFLSVYFLVLYLGVTYPYIIYSQHRFIISSYGYLALSDFSLISRFSSIFDACYHVYLSKYPIISDLFREVLVSGIRGEEIVENLNRLSSVQPSESFREGLQSTLVDYRRDKQGLSRTYDDALNIYRNLTAQIETKFSILMGLCFFTPIITLIFLSMYAQGILQIIFLSVFEIFVLSLIYFLLTRSIVKHRIV